MKTGKARPGFCLVFRREWRWYLRRPILLALSTYIPLGMFAFLAMIFWNGVATSLPIAILDEDNTQLSRTMATQVDASPTVEVVAKVSSLYEGKKGIRGGQFYGMILIPEHFSRDVIMGRQPEINVFFNTQMMSAGNQVAKAVGEVLPALAAQAQASVRMARGMTATQAAVAVQPIPMQSHALFNPTFDYGFFVLSGIIAAVLQLTIGLAASYAIAAEFEIDPKLKVLRRMGGGIFNVLLAKLIPVFVLSCIVYAICDTVMFGLFKLPLEGSRAVLFGSTMLFILACQLFGLMFAVLLKSTSALAPTGILLAPAFGYLGVSFPRLAMSDFSLAFSYVLPGKAYIPVRFDQTLRGAPVQFSAGALREQVIYLIVIALVIAVASYLMIRKSDRSTKQEQNDTPSSQDARPSAEGA